MKKSTPRLLVEMIATVFVLTAVCSAFGFGIVAACGGPGWIGAVVGAIVAGAALGTATAHLLSSEEGDDE